MLIFRKRISTDCLPVGLHWEVDGSCWECVLDATNPNGYIWLPMNFKAFAKESPEGEMTDFYMPTAEEWERQIPKEED